MNETIYMVLALVSGLVIGVLFFGGLWFTVKKAMGAKTPGLWFFGSFATHKSGKHQKFQEYYFRKV